MRRRFTRIKGLGYVLWHARHEFYHVVLGLLWAWVLREVWQELNFRWILTAVFGSLLPDADHVVYWITYGKRDPYTKMVFSFVKQHEWRILVKFIEKGHKYQTNLVFHNYYMILALFGVSTVSFVYDWRVGVVLFGAMVIHYVFDIVDDLVTLGHTNPNWKRLRPSKSRITRVESIEI